MNIYQQFGVEPIINLWGTATGFGGSLMAPETVDAIVEASKYCVRIDELQGAASTFIAKATGAEAGYVTCGAHSGMLLSTAACIAGLDLVKMERLPDSRAMPNEVLMAKDQRSGWDHAIRAAGGVIVDVGFNEAFIGSLRNVDLWEYEAAITERTVAIAYVAYTLDEKKAKKIAQLAELAHKHNIYLIVDAAASVPPIANLRSVIEQGADLVAFSGGKALRGPQNTGILCGRQNLIASVALQHLDMTGHSEFWNPPASIIPPGLVPGQPRQGLGRGMKVSKEVLVGLLARLRALTLEKTLEEAAHMEGILLRLVEGFKDLKGVSCALSNRAADGSGAAPSLQLTLNPKIIGADGFEISRRLRDGRPRLMVNEKQLSDNILLITAVSLPPELVDNVIERMRAVFQGAK